MTPRQHQPGEVDYTGHISKCGDREVRQALYAAAGSLLRRCRKSCALRTWGLRIMKRGGIKKATVAVSRRMAVIMHRMWLGGTDFRCSKDIGAAAATVSASVRSCSITAAEPTADRVTVHVSGVESWMGTSALSCGCGSGVDDMQLREHAFTACAVPIPV